VNLNIYLTTVFATVSRSRSNTKSAPLTYWFNNRSASALVSTCASHRINHPFFSDCFLLSEVFGSKGWYPSLPHRWKGGQTCCSACHKGLCARTYMHQFLIRRQPLASLLLFGETLDEQIAMVAWSVEVGMMTVCPFSCHQPVALGSDEAVQKLRSNKGDPAGLIPVGSWQLFCRDCARIYTVPPSLQFYGSSANGGSSSVAVPDSSSLQVMLQQLPALGYPPFASLSITLPPFCCTFFLGHHLSAAFSAEIRLTEKNEIRQWVWKGFAT